MKATSRRRLPEHVADAMHAILDYLWQDEAEDYLLSSLEVQSGHVFQDMLTVRQWLDRRDGHAKHKATKGKKKATVPPENY